MKPETDELSQRVDYVGPFSYHAVVIEGWQVPYLTATPMQGGKVFLNLDNRFALELSVQDAERVVPFIADAIAVASGFTAHPRPSEGLSEPRPRTPYRRLTALTMEPGNGDAA